MDTKWFLDRLADRDLTVRRAAGLLGMSNHTALSKALHGQRQFKPQELADFARHLGVALEEVQRRAGVELPRESRAMVPVVGLVDRQGAIGSLPKNDGPRRVERPTKAEDDMAAVRIAAPNHPMDGWVIYYVPSTRLEPEAVGRLAIVGLPDGRKFLRVLVRGYERGRWSLRAMKQMAEGVETVEDVALSWATPALWAKM